MTNLPSPTWRRDERLVLVAIAVNFLGFRVFGPFMLFFIQELGITAYSELALWSGLIYGVTPFLAGLVTPWWGSLADRYSLRRIGFSMLIATTGTTLALVLVTNVYQFFALRMVLGLVSGFAILGPAMLSQITPAPHLTQAIGMWSALRTGMSAVGPAVGGLIIASLGMRPLFLVAAALMALSLALYAIAFRPSHPGTVKSTPLAKPLGLLGSLRAILAAPMARVILVTMFLDQIALQGFGLVLPLAVTAVQGSGPTAVTTTGFLVSTGAVAGALSAVLTGRVSRRVGPLAVIRFGALTGALCCLALAVFLTIPTLGLLYVILCLATGGVSVVAMALGGQVIPPELRTTAFGIFGSAMVMSSAFSPILVGALASVDLRIVLALDACVFAGLWMMWVRRQAHTPEAD